MTNMPLARRRGQIIPGAGRLGQAFGGAAGYLLGGVLSDAAQAYAMPALPWHSLALIGGLTWLRLRGVFQSLKHEDAHSPTTYSRI